MLWDWDMRAKEGSVREEGNAREEAIVRERVCFEEGRKCVNGKQFQKGKERWGEDKEIVGGGVGAEGTGKRAPLFEHLRSTHPETSLSYSWRHVGSLHS